MSRSSRAAALLLANAALCAAAGCGGDDRGAHPLDPGGERDARYELRVWANPAATPGAAEGLRVRIEPRGGWHLAPEAPAWLRLEEPAEMRLEPSFEGTEGAEAAALEFRAEYAAGERRLRGQLKFGVCEDGDSRCAIVRRDLVVALPAPG